MKLFYRHFGSGEPVIILHGLFGLSDNWVTHGKRLAEKFSVYLPDLRNHGHSPHSPTFNYPAMADDLHEFIDEHKLQNPVIIGHSMGGKVAMWFALEYPELVSKLIIVDISPVKYPDRDAHFDIISTMMSIDFDAVHSREEVSNLLSLTIPNKTTRLFILKNLYRKTRNNFDWRLNLSAISNNMDHVFAGIDVDSVYEKPVLFIKGGRSDYILSSHEPIIKKYFPNSEIETIEHVGHWVHAEAPEEICSIFSRFLEKECTFQP
jgi:esterase